MPLGTNNNNNTIFLTPVLKKGEDYRFIISRKIDNKWVKEEEGAKSVSGDITGIKQNNYEYEGDTVKKIILFMDDGEDSYGINLNFSVAGKGLFNSLLALDSFKDVVVSIYTTKDGDWPGLTGL